MQQQKNKSASENDYITIITRDKVRCMHRWFLYCICIRSKYIRNNLDDIWKTRETNDETCGIKEVICMVIGVP